MTEERSEKNLVRVFLDDDPKPFAEFRAPVRFVLDTSRLTDGQHRLRIVARSTDGREGVKEIKFQVRNGPAITVVGLAEGDVVEDKVPVLINSYGSERKDFFIVSGSETPKAIPSWIWAMVILFAGWAVFYVIMYWTSQYY
ncbi:MAG TPA: hypothetical protein VKZ86_11890 [Cyclobacteriaceae bacterium]|nr:hypothetical protein [Cyclobacteriaceae bacterium]